MKIWRSERGQVLVMVALSMAVLLACAGIAVDMGLLFRSQRNMQIAADAAAVAGALDYKFNHSLSSCQSAGVAAAAANGMTAAAGGPTVTVNCPPQSGPNSGNAGFAEAILSQPNSTFFMGMFNHKSATVAARAVAGSGVNAGCVFTLGTSGIDFPISGSAVVSVPGCDVFDNSESGNALTLSGNSSLTAKSLGIVGGYSVSGGATVSPTPVTGITPTADPLSTLPAPEIPTGTCSSTCTPSNTGSANMTLQAGNYNSISNSSSGTLTLSSGNYIINGNVSINGGTTVFGPGEYVITGDLDINGSSNVTLGAGLYIVEGNLNLTGSGSLAGSGVTFYTEGSSSISGGSSMSLTAPTSGVYDGILLFQSRSDNKAIAFSGGTNSTLEGVIYGPAASMSMSGGSDSTIYTDIVVDSLKFTGNTSFQSYAAIDSSALPGKTALEE